MEHLYPCISELKERHKKLGVTIALLESMERVGVDPFKSRAGRKSMDTKERQEVSKRMKKYWASQRKGKSN